MGEGLGSCQEGGGRLGEKAMKDGMHPYEALPLSTAGITVGVYLIAAHALMLAKPEQVQGVLKKLPRNVNAGYYSMGVGMLWFWLLVAPDIRGNLSWLGALSMDLGEFNALKPMLRIGGSARLLRDGDNGEGVPFCSWFGNRGDVCGGPDSGRGVFEGAGHAGVALTFCLRIADEGDVLGGNALYLSGCGHVGDENCGAVEASGGGRIGLWRAGAIIQLHQLEGALNCKDS